MTLPNGYTMESTFLMDFEIANAFGLDAIRETRNIAFECFKNDPKYLAELVVALNLNLWAFYKEGNDKYAELYNELWETTHDWALDNLKGEDFSTYYRIVD